MSELAYSNNIESINNFIEKIKRIKDKTIINNLTGYKNINYGINFLDDKVFIYLIKNGILCCVNTLIYLIFKNINLLNDIDKEKTIQYFNHNFNLVKYTKECKCYIEYKPYIILEFSFNKKLYDIYDFLNLTTKMRLFYLLLIGKNECNFESKSKFYKFKQINNDETVIYNLRIILHNFLIINKQKEKSNCIINICNNMLENTFIIIKKSFLNNGYPIDLSYIDL